MIRDIQKAIDNIYFCRGYLKDSDAKDMKFADGKLLIDELDETAQLLLNSKRILEDIRNTIK